MLQRKSLTWFIILSFAISWPLFLTPLLLVDLDTVTRQAATQGLWALAMWGPGLAAIITVLAVEKKSFKSLRLNTIGPKRFYLWAWFLMPVLVILSAVITVLFRFGTLDFEFTFLRQLIEQTGAELPVPIEFLPAVTIFQALTFGTLINILFTMGEELGWRGFLLPRLMPLGQWKALIIGGLIWGLWHAPAIAQGHNYPDHPVLGILLMTFFTVLVGIIIGWLYLKTRSPWVAAVAHASLNAWGALPFIFLKPGFDTALGGTLTSLSGWLIMGIFIGWLLLTKRMPVPAQSEAKE